jgi:hypothetical protein
MWNQNATDLHRSFSKVGGVSDPSSFRLTQTGDLTKAGTGRKLGGQPESHVTMQRLLNSETNDLMLIKGESVIGSMASAFLRAFPANARLFPLWPHRTFLRRRCSV